MTLSKKDKLGIALIVGAIVVIIAVVGGTFAIQRITGTSSKIDPETLCPYSGGYAHAVILVDKTDPFSDPQKKLFRGKVLEIRQSLQTLEKLSIYVLDDKNYLAPQPVFAVCNPGSSDAANPLYQNPRLWQKRYQERFGKPLDQIVDQLTGGTE